MTTFTLLGSNSGFFGDGFLTNNGELDVDILFADATTVILDNPDTGITTTITGTGFAFAGPAGDEQPISGVVTGISMSSNNNTFLEGTVTGINWNFVALAGALDAVSSDNFQPFADLLNAGGPITIDGSLSGGGPFNDGLIMFDLIPPELVVLITQPMTVTGGPGSDLLYGGAGDDTILYGGNTEFNGGGGSASYGNDTIDFSNVTPFDGPWFSYSELIDGAVTININSVTNVSSVLGDGFTDTLVDMRRIMEGDGIGIGASEENDTFNVVVSEGAWINLSGAQGDDTFNLTLNGDARVSFFSALDFFDDREALSSGVNVDLSTGIVSNDGFGGQDTINFLGGDGRLEVRGTDLDDTFLGSDRDDSFITDEGADTVDGGAGFDRVRYDRFDVQSVSVDLAAETATATWITGFDEFGVVFAPFTDTLISIEHVRGSRDGNDTLSGAASDDIFEGEGGADILSGLTGNDELYGGTGNDTLVGNQGADTLLGENGDDRLDGGLDADSVSGGNGDDTVIGGGGFDTLRGGNGDDTVNGGDGRDLVFMGGGDDLFVDNTQGGANGADTVLANGGNDTIGGGAGNDRFEGQDGNDLLLGRLGNDVLFGGNQNDTLEGGDGNDTVAGGNGADRAFLGNGADRWFDNAQEQFGNDFVVGGNGNDWIQAGGGNDTLAGGAGADTFVLAANINDDVITDYDVGTDNLEINANLWNGALNQARLDALAGVQNGNLIFDFDNGDSLTLVGVTSTAGLLGDIELG